MKAFATHGDGDEIRVGPGEYNVPCGALMLKDALLTGTPDTIIRARENSATHARDDAIIASFSPAKKKRCAVRGTRFDCNLQDQNYASAVIAAVPLLGGRPIEDCSAINWDTKGVENFVFIIACQPGYGGLDSPHILRCKVEEPAPIPHSATNPAHRRGRAIDIQILAPNPSQQPRKISPIILNYGYARV